MGAACTTPVSSGARKARQHAIASASKLPKRETLGQLPAAVEAHFKTLEVALINALEDNAEFKSEYERIAEEGRLLYTTYASKSNQLKQLAVINVKLQADAQAAREREAAAIAAAEAEKAEQLKWKQKVKEQTDRHKEAFATLERLKNQAVEDAATIKRLQACASSSTTNATAAAGSAASSGGKDMDLERRYKELEKKYQSLRQKIEKKSAPGNNNTSVSALKERVDSLTLLNEMLREDNRTLLLDIANSGDGAGKFASRAKLEEKELEISSMRLELEKSKSTAAKLQADLDLLTTQYQEEKNQQEAKFAEELDDLKQALVMAKARSTLLEAEIVPLKAAAAEGEAAQRALKEIHTQDYSRRLAAAIEERDLWRGRAEDMSLLLEQAVETDVKQQAIAEKLRDTILYLKGETIRVQREHKQAQQKLKEAEETLAKIPPMEEQTKQYQEHIDRVEHRCISLVRSLADTERRMEELELNTAEVRKEASELRRAKAELETELEEQRILCRDFEDCSKESEQMVSTLMNKLALLDTEKAKLEKNYSEAVEENATLLKQKEELTTLSGNLFEASEARSSELEEKDAEIEAIGQQLIAMQKTVEAQQAVCRDLSEKLDRKNEEYHRSLEAKREECNSLRKLLDGGAASREDANEKKRRAELEGMLEELETNLEAERDALQQTTELLAEAESEVAKLRAQIFLEQNVRQQMELVQESLLEVASGRTACCCLEVSQMVALMKEERAATEEEQMAAVKDLAKGQTIIDQQNRYINVLKGKSNNKIRLLHAQLVAAKEDAGKYSEVLEQLKSGVLALSEI